MTGSAEKPQSLWGPAGAQRSCSPSLRRGVLGVSPASEAQASGIAQNRYWLGAPGVGGVRR